ncbi:MAG: GDSL-type esterase/lipase family protein [Muribaculaceae bacterium]|jgi:lysophospholipase L1-like esterase|nr:GDSL-type esterase/lipase family protein [Muribaculaceae bacterium]
MNRLRLIILSVAISAAAFCASAADVVVTPDNPAIAYTGRISFKNPMSPMFTNPGTLIQANFTGTSIKMKAKPGSGYFEVQIDAAEPFKIAFLRDSVITLASNLQQGSHSVSVMLAFEGYQARPQFRGFCLDEGASILPPPARPTRKIQFIGNSMTCAYGVEAPNGKVHYKDSNSNFFFSYATLTARALNAQNITVARSGIGIYRNYNGPLAGSPDNMARWYDYTLMYDSTQVWNHQSYVPDVICVNLGTNDFSMVPYRVSLYVKSYKAFLKHLRALFPSTKIVILTGCMLDGNALADQNLALDAMFAQLNSEGFTGLYRFALTTQDGTYGYGADFHPSKDQHRHMADELVPYLKKLMNW